MEELISFTRLTRKVGVKTDCPIAKKREKTLKKRKVSDETVTRVATNPIHFRSKVAEILKKSSSLRTCEENRYLDEHPDALKEVSERKQRIEKYKDRALEKEDKPEIIELKAKKLAAVIANAKHLIVYSGAIMNSLSPASV